MLFAFLTIFFTAFSLLSYEILLTRLLAIINWSHYAYMVVSMAMLGLAFSGVSLVLFPGFFNRWRDDAILLGCFLFSITIPLAFQLNQKLPLNYLYLLWDWRQFVYLGLSYFLYGTPFLISSMILALFFLQYPTRAGQVYGGNLLGSGSGVFMAIAIMYIIPPEQYLAAIAISAALAGFFWGMHSSSTLRKSSALIMFALVLLLQYHMCPTSIVSNVSEYKGLSWLLRLPNTKIVHRLYNPLGLLHIVEGKSIRLAPGLSMNFKGELPPQRALTIDAGSPTPVINFDGDFNELAFMGEQIFSAGYQLVETPNVLIIGAGGGSVVTLAGYHKSKSITAVEMNSNVIRAVEDVLGDSFYHRYRKLNVKLIIKEARGYLEETGEKFDLIQLNPMGSLLASASGVYAQNEDYLNTLEAYQLFYRRLSDQGIFMVSRWLQTPARDGIKLFTTGFHALERIGTKHPETHLALIRSWDIVMLLVKRSPFKQNELKTLRQFCSMRNFDVCYLPGIKEDEVNQFNKLPQDIYYLSAKSIIHPTTRGEFYTTYPFQIKPATDDKPYFSNFFRWAALPHLIKTLGREWLPFSEYGYLVLLATFIQTVIIGGVLILLPMGILLKKDTSLHSSFNKHVWFYFIALGFSYMLLEMALIQKFILFLHHPIYSLSAVIASFLLVSGIGSLCSKRFLQKSVGYQIIPFIATLIFGIFYAFSLDWIFAQFGWAPLYLRLWIAFLIIAPLAFFMGMPFPFGMQRITETGEKNTGGAWGYNGFFSVMGTVVTPILAGILGFKIVGILGCLGYVIAVTVWVRKWQ